MDYSEAIKFLDSLVNYEKFPKTTYDFDLEGYREFLKTIGNPEKKLKNVILVAGTKGKGSTCAFIESALRACGFKTGLYTSPHLLSIQERIRVSGREINEKRFARLVSKIAPFIENFKGRPITFFEALTTIAFLYFQEAKTDYNILEVGLGGRLDATNVSEPEVSVITRIGFDHTDVLGDTLSKIAAEKVGIIHTRSLVVSAPQEGEVKGVIEKRCRDTHSALFFVEDESEVEFQRLDTSGCLFLANGPWGKQWFSIPVLGRHQITNALTALVVLSHLIKLKIKGPELLWSKLAEGLGRTRLHARCEMIKRRPLILLDSCHNPDSALALKKVIEDVFRNRPVVLVLGLSSDKPAKPILETMLPLARRTFLTQAKTPRALPVKQLLLKARDLGYDPLPTTSLKSALSKALRVLAPEDLLVITGSFFIAGETLTYFRRKMRPDKLNFTTKSTKERTLMIH